MSVRIAVPGKGQECHLSAVTANRKCWTAQTQKIRNLTAQWSNNSSSKAGDSTTPLLSRKREVRGSFWPSPRIIAIRDIVIQFERVIITYTGPTGTAQVIDWPKRKKKYWGVCFGKPKCDRAREGTRGHTRAREGSRVSLPNSCGAVVVRFILPAKFRSISN